MARKSENARIESEQRRTNVALVRTPMLRDCCCTEKVSGGYRPPIFCRIENKEALL